MLASEAEPPPIWVSAPRMPAAAPPGCSERIEKATSEWYWSAARAQRYQTLAAKGTSTRSTKEAISPQCRSFIAAGCGPGTADQPRRLVRRRARPRPPAGTARRLRRVRVAPAPPHRPLGGLGAAAARGIALRRHRAQVGAGQGAAAVLWRWRHRFPRSPGRATVLVIASRRGLLLSPDESKSRPPRTRRAHGGVLHDGGISRRAGCPAPGDRVRFRPLRVVFALVLREMGTRFGRSAGGYLWALLEPLGGIVLLAVAFGLALRTPPMGTSFLLFYATGIVPFSMFNTMSKAVSTAVSSNKGLLTYPVVTLLDAVLAKFLLNLLTLVAVAVILFTGIVQIYGLDIEPRPRRRGGGHGAGGGARPRHRHAQLRALRLLPDLEERLGGADPAAVPALGHLLHLRERAAAASRRCCGGTRSCT